MNISWNDVDFAIILGFLVTGPRATQSTKDLFASFSRLRINQALAARGDFSRKGFLTCWCVSATAGAVTLLTGGLAAPITGPLFVGGCFSGLGFGFAGDAINARDVKMWKKRIEGCQDLQRRFPQLEGFFEE